METLSGLRIFARVVENGSFSAAGRQLGMAPSSVSRQINDLEEDLGARLFNRTTRKLSLTEAGHLYHDKAVQILLDVDEARLAVAQQDGQPSGVLRVSTPSGIGREVIASALPVFLKRYPGVQVVLSMTDKIVDMVEESLDLGIRVGVQRDSSLIAKKVGASRRLVCASPAYFRKAGTPKHPTELVNHNCLTWREHPGSNLWRFKGPKDLLDVRVSGNFFANSADALSGAALAGLGLILLPDWNIGTELRQRKLRVVLGDYQAIPAASPIYAVYPHQRHMPIKVRAFVDFLAEHFRDRDVMYRD